MSVIVVSKWVGTGRAVVNGYPKRPLGRLCETDYASLTESNQASDVNGTRPETHARMDFSSYFSSALPSYGLLGDFNILKLEVVS